MHTITIWSVKWLSDKTIGAPDVHATASAADKQRSIMYIAYKKRSSQLLIPQNQPACRMFCQISKSGHVDWQVWIYDVCLALTVFGVSTYTVVKVLQNFFCRLVVGMHLHCGYRTANKLALRGENVFWNQRGRHISQSSEAKRLLKYASTSFRYFMSKYKTVVSESSIQLVTYC